MVPAAAGKKSGDVQRREKRNEDRHHLHTCSMNTQRILIINAKEWLPTHILIYFMPQSLTDGEKKCFTA